MDHCVHGSNPTAGGIQLDLIDYHPSSQYDLINVERDIKTRNIIFLFNLNIYILMHFWGLISETVLW